MSNALLLAEPEPATRGFLERHLRQDGFDVVEALDGEAVELLELTRPDLVLAADSLAADLCRRAANVPIIVLGRADSDPVDRVRAFDGGCDDYVSRPFRYEELLARIRAVLRRVSPPTRERIEVGDLLIDRGSRRLGHARREGIRAARQAGRRARAGLHEGAAVARGLGLQIPGAHTHPRLARLAAAAEARGRGRRLRPERVGRRVLAYGLTASVKRASTGSQPVW